MSRVIILLFYFVASVVAVYLLHGLSLTTKKSQLDAVGRSLSSRASGQGTTSFDFDYSKCDSANRNADEEPPEPGSFPPAPKNVLNDDKTSTREEILKQYLLPYVYMDEEFHIPQAAAYFFLGNLTHWDNMITTPMGAYAATYLLLRPFFYIRGKVADSPSSSVPLWATTAKLEPKVEAFLGEPEKLFRSVVQFILSWNWRPSEMVTLSRLSNCLVATLAVSILLGAFTKMSLRRTNARFLVPVTKQDYVLNEETKKYEVSPENLAVLNKLYEARSHILGRCRRIVVPAVLQIGFYPTLFFFTALYYTEPMSVLCLALTFYVYQSASDKRSFFGCWLPISIFGFAATMVRQTNIVWVAYFAASHLIDVLCGYDLKFREQPQQSSPSSTDEDKVKNINKNKDDNKSSKSLGSRIFRMLFYTLPSQIPVILLGVGFVAWAVFWNDGSIVVGDKSSHKPTIHLAQIPLMFCFFALFSPFQTLHSLYDVLIKSQSSPSTAVNASKKISMVVVPLLLALVGGFFAVASTSMQFHPYLIADNRHYTFYLYRYILKNDKLRAALLVGGGVAGFILTFRDSFKSISLLLTSSAKNGNNSNIIARVVLQDLLFFAMSCIVIVPQKLIEPRYFLVPGVFQILRTSANRLEMLTMTKHERLEMSQFGEDRTQVEELVDCQTSFQTLDVGVNLIVHVVTMHIFLYFPFWAPDGTIGRFMW